MFAPLRRRIGSITLFAALFVSGAYGMSANSAYADDCLTAPTSSAPGENQVFYGIDLGKTLKCWYLRALGQSEQKIVQSEQKIVVRDKSTAAPARRPQLVRRQPASMPRAAQPRTQISIARVDGTRPSPDVGTPTIKTQLMVIASATAGETLERSAEEDTPSPPIQQVMVRNSDASEVDDQAVEPRPPSRIVWPVPVSEVPQGTAQTSPFAKNETVKLVRSEAEARTTDDTSTVQPRERTTESLRVTPLVVILFLSLGLPGACILAWLVIKADTARAEQLVRNHLPLKRTCDLGYNNKGLVDRLDDQRQVDWIDDFLANWRQSLTTRNSVFASARQVHPSPEAIEAALRQIMPALRHRLALGCDFNGYAPPPGQ
jgi:hypothetical protein